tara:strand:+ start:14157 stop:15221 length:1065 start_codon:yes stop_codon:yes gene_type:complete
MATEIGGAGIKIQQLSSAPSSPVAGQVYWDTTTKEMKLWDANRWNVVNRDTDFLLRHVITTGFVAGGYKDSVPWQNVEEMSHATDIMVNRGNVLTAAGAYVSGACSLTQGYVFGVDGTWPGDTTSTVKYNLWQLTGAAGPTMRHSRNDSATIFREHYMAWIIAGNTGTTDVDVLNLATDSMYTSSQSVSSASGGDSMQEGGASHSSENSGLWWYATNNRQKLSFPTSTSSTAGSFSVPTGQPGINSQQKGISSKHDKGYGGNEGSYNNGYNFRIYSYTTDTVTGNCTKPMPNTGEENFDMGQDWQYAAGTYDGAQNNRGHKFYYATNSGYELGAGSVRTAVPGSSSGHMHWRGN